MKVLIATFRFNRFLENTYVLYSNKRDAIIIDPGMSNTMENEALESFLNYLSLQPSKILLTHAHIDHILGCSYLQRQYDIPVFIHTKELSSLKNFRKTAEENGFLSSDTISKAETIMPGSNITFSETMITCKSVPGHSPGSLMFELAEQEILFTGDVIFNNALGRTDLPGGNEKQLLDSVKAILKYPEKYKIFPGHGPVTTVKKEIEANIAYQTLLKKNL